LTLKTNHCVSSPHLRALTAFLLVIFSLAHGNSQPRTRSLQNPTSGDPVSKILLLRIVRAEDERRWDDDLRTLFSARNAAVRSRAALAAGRIGNEAAVADLVHLLEKDDETTVRAMAAFALGEIESALGAEALVAVLRDNRDAPLRARSVEALGKIVAALPKEQATRAHELAAVVLEALNFEARRRSAPDSSTILLGLTATLRAKPDNAGPIVAEFLHYSDPRIRADAANTLARLKLKDGNEPLRSLLVTDPDPVVRANAARVLGATEDKTSSEPLLDRALNDKDSRVRVSAIRSLGSLKDQRAGRPLVEYGHRLLREKPLPAGELLELATVIGRIFQGAADGEASRWLLDLSNLTGRSAPEVEVARVKMSARDYLLELATTAPAKRRAQEIIQMNWRAASSLAQALGEIAPLLKSARDTNWGGTTGANAYNSKGVAFFGSSHMNNESNYMYRKLIANFGTSNVEHQARI